MVRFLVVVVVVNIGVDNEDGGCGQVEGEGDAGRRVTLVLSERLKVLAQQLLELVQARQPVGLPLHTINSVYLWQFGVTLNPATYQCHTMAELLAKLPTLQVYIHQTTCCCRNTYHLCKVRPENNRANHRYYSKALLFYLLLVI